MAKKKVARANNQSNAAVVVGLLVVISVILGALTVNVCQKVKEVKLMETLSNSDEAYAETMQGNMKYARVTPAVKMMRR